MADGAGRVRCAARARPVPPARAMAGRAARTVPAARTAAILAAAALLACAEPAIDRREGAEGLRGVELADPIEVPDFTLTDTRGEPYRFRSGTAGRLTFLFFGYTSCPDICPVHMANLAAALGDLPYDQRRRVEVVFVSTDPDRDTPERIRAWLDRFDRGFVGLRGPLERVNEIQRALRLPPAVVQALEERQADTSRTGTDYLVGHASQILAVTGDGRARVAYPAGIRQTDWRHDLRELLAPGASGPAGGGGDPAPR